MTENSGIYRSIKKAMDSRLINEAAIEIYELWKQQGCPEPPDGPSTETRIPILVNESIEGLSDDQSDEYNDLMIALLEATGIRYIGSGLWYSDWNKGTEDWEEFKQKAYNIAADFIAADLWERYCDGL